MGFQAKRCGVVDVEGQIKELTDQHATGEAFISRQVPRSESCKPRNRPLTVDDMNPALP